MEGPYEVSTNEYKSLFACLLLDIAGYVHHTSMRFAANVVDDRLSNFISTRAVSNTGRSSTSRDDVDEFDGAPTLGSIIESLRNEFVSLHFV